MHMALKIEEIDQLLLFHLNINHAVLSLPELSRYLFIYFILIPNVQFSLPRVMNLRE